ncbi:unnamed protein product [Arctia plantaginis]|uniref:Uncharacterized protein n=1 Tax=Arctia plantaginis TaxID=874455 RepID=A0A8S1B7I7_ARCPL|nr:unnamed protein product [Arctia plantaginis]CAB3255593.1 unnamed protein product [Arctia plantaginis]
MAKYTSLLFCIVAASLAAVTAVTDEEKAVFREAMEPIIAACSAEHSVSEGDIKAAKELHYADNIKPCFIGCVMKKTEILDSNGLYDAEKGLSKLRKFVKSDEDFAKFESVAKKCLKVNDEPVSDGAAGCDRAKLIMACAVENKAEIPI